MKFTTLLKLLKPSVPVESELPNGATRATDVVATTKTQIDRAGSSRKRKAVTEDFQPRKAVKSAHDATGETTSCNVGRDRQPLPNKWDYTGESEKRFDATLFSRLQWVLDESIYRSLPDINDWPVEFRVRDFKYTWRRDAETDRTFALENAASDEDRLERVKELCRSLCVHVQLPIGHLERLDEAFSQFLEVNIYDLTVPKDVLVRQACNVLSRLALPIVSCCDPMAAQICSTLDRQYFLDESASVDPSDLKVAHHTSRMILALALQVNREPIVPSPMGRAEFFGSVTQNLVNFVAELLEGALALTSDNTTSSGDLLVLRCFLWVAWHQAKLLHRWYILKRTLARGTNYQVRTTVAINISDTIENTQRTAPKSNDYRSSIGIPPSMCKWAFELLRSDIASRGVDFQPFLSRYWLAFGDLPARCVRSDEKGFVQCNGRSPDQCTRFVGARIEDQSAHSDSCSGRCPRLFWSETSYRMCTGARAVCLYNGKDDRLEYTTATERTMAVSHVWSHGQGGRPEKARGSTGFNACLHRRYSKIARRYGCDSYWMDTPCIPQNHALRREAIASINEVFSTSRLTVVCDRDIMKIRAEPLTVEVQEAILAALLVCDWNVRAWTLLEGMRSAKNIHLLCKDDSAVSLAGVTKTVHESGCVELVNLVLAAQHLLPSLWATGTRVPVNGRQKLINSPDVEEAAGLLSHRHASREGDEVVIWSLLTDQPLSETAEEFWSNVSHITTGFLMSDAPRVRNVKGLGWAPARPDLSLKTRVGQLDQEYRFAYAGAGSKTGTIDSFGLTAEWLVCEVCCERSWRSLMGILRSLLIKIYAMLHILAVRPRMDRGELLILAFMYYWRLVCIPDLTRQAMKHACADTARGHAYTLLLRPMRRDRGRLEVPAYDYAGSANGPLCAIVTSDELPSANAHFITGSYTWRKVVEWDTRAPLPPFLPQYILIE